MVLACVALGGVMSYPLTNPCSFVTTACSARCVPLGRTMSAEETRTRASFWTTAGPVPAPCFEATWRACTIRGPAKTLCGATGFTRVPGERANSDLAAWWERKREKMSGQPVLWDGNTWNVVKWVAAPLVAGTTATTGIAPNLFWDLRGLLTIPYSATTVLRNIGITLCKLSPTYNIPLG